MAVSSKLAQSLAQPSPSSVADVEAFNVGLPPFFFKVELVQLKLMLCPCSRESEDFILATGPNKRD
jgi:hypothetical protein